MKKLVLAFTAVSLICATSAQAAPRPGHVAVLRLCGPQVKQLCPSQKGPGLRQCIVAHKDSLSDACKAALAAAHMKAEKLKRGA